MKMSSLLGWFYGAPADISEPLASANPVVADDMEFLEALLSGYGDENPCSKVDSGAFKSEEEARAIFALHLLNRCLTRQQFNDITKKYLEVVEKVAPNRLIARQQEFVGYSTKFNAYTLIFRLRAIENDLEAFCKNVTSSDRCNRKRSGTVVHLFNDKHGCDGALERREDAFDEISRYVRLFDILQKIEGQFGLRQLELEIPSRCFAIFQEGLGKQQFYGGAYTNVVAPFELRNEG